MNKYATYFFTALRILVGWHFLYEGISKLLTPGWTAKLYLMGSNWIFADLFHRMAASDVTMKIIDFLNIWGLILIGFLLFIGLLVRWASVAGSLLLLLYFIAYPPIPGYTFGTVNEGSYLWVNKNLIELFILLVFIALPPALFYGADRLIKRWREEKAHAPIPDAREEGMYRGRRELLKDMISLPFLGAFAYALYKKNKWDSFEEKLLKAKPDSVSGSTLLSFNFSKLDDLKGQVPKGRIGNVELSRMILGGNLIGGWAHARDLLYASDLVKAYHTDERVMMTFQLAEKCGINTVLTNPALIRIIKKYWHETDGKIQFISDCGSKTLIEGIRLSEEAGAAAMYVHGGECDRLVQDCKYDEIAKALELIRSFGKPAGIGGHRLETIKGCVAHGIKPDFWMKTLHHLNYWSARPGSDQSDMIKYDNIWCEQPVETVEFMNSLEEPWIAFKVLAAGAIRPKEGFKYAFDSGADFICVGMYDFQIVNDVNIALDSLTNVNRVRPWRG